MRRKTTKRRIMKATAHARKLTGSIPMSISTFSGFYTPRPFHCLSSAKAVADSITFAQGTYKVILSRIDSVNIA
jgi:predicted membrane-bound mannosyltransferase